MYGAAGVGAIATGIAAGLVIGGGEAITVGGTWAWLQLAGGTGLRATAAGFGAALAKAKGCGSGGPQVQSAIGQVGFRDPRSIDALKQAMAGGRYRYDSPEGQIAGIVDGSGRYFITEGHHRMAAALELAKETGDWSYVQRLLDNGLFRTGPPPPLAGPMPTRGWW